MDLLASGLQFPEGPAVAASGELFVTEIAGQRISRIAGNGTVDTFSITGGGPNGAAFGPNGDLFVCNNGGRWPTDVPSTSSADNPEYGRGFIQRISPSGEVLDELFEIEGVSLNSPNDLCFDNHGGYYFTDPIWSGLEGGSRLLGPVYYVNAEGVPSLVADGIGFPNGIGVRGDAEVLIICESLTGMLLSYRIESPGVLSSSGKPSGMIGRRSVPDGFCFDASGQIIVAGHGTNNLFVLDGRDGRPIDVIELPEKGPTNCCFGGSDFKTLFITSSDQGNVFAMNWPIEGMQLLHTN